MYTRYLFVFVIFIFILVVFGSSIISQNASNVSTTRELYFPITASSSSTPYKNANIRYVFTPPTNLFNTPNGIESTTTATIANPLSSYKTTTTESMVNQNSVHNTNTTSSDFFSYSPLLSSLYKTTVQLNFPQDQKHQEQFQIELHDYANTIGEILSTFELSHSNQTRTLDAFFKDHSQTGVVVALGNDYITLSETIASIQAPKAASSVHNELVHGYALVGKGLNTLTTFTNEKDLLSKTLSYNENAQTVAKAHINIVTLLSANGVTFKPYEPGAVFVFKPLQ